MKRRLFLMAGLLLSGWVPAQTVTYQFSGTIDTINFNYNNAFPEGCLGQSFSGWFSYSEDSIATEQGAIEFSIGTFQSSVIDDRLYAPVAQSNLYFYYYGVQGDYDYGRTGFTFLDFSGVEFANASQLPTNLMLSMFDHVVFRIQGSKVKNGTYQGNFDLSGQVQTLQLVPEPSTVMLLTVGALAVPRKHK